MSGYHETKLTGADRKSGSAGMPRPISYAVFCLKKKNHQRCTRYIHPHHVTRIACRRTPKRGRHGSGVGCALLMRGPVCVGRWCSACCFFFNDPATTEIYTLSLHDALPISEEGPQSEQRTGSGKEREVQGPPEVGTRRSEERFSRNAETDIACRLLLGQ